MTSCDKSCDCGPDPVTTETAAAPSNEGTWVSSFSVPKMDCPSEERMIRLALNGFPELNSLAFDLSTRQVRAFHDGPVDHIATKLESLGLGAAGLFQIVLALGVLVEVARRFIYGSEPESLLMMGIGLVALVANAICLLMIYGHREGGAHMKASWIFSANDVLANIGVIAAGALVAWTGSSYPDLVIGAVVGIIVLNGARRILALKA